MSHMGIKLIGVAVLTMGTACGGGRDTSSSISAVTVAAGDVAYVDALAAQWAASPDYTDKQARCIAAGIVEVVGVEALTAAGISAEDIRQHGLVLLPPNVTPFSLPSEQTTPPQLAPTVEQLGRLNDSQEACTQGRAMATVWQTELDAEGTTEQKLSMSSNIAADDEQTYVGLSDGVLHALRSSDGMELWTFDATGGADPARFADSGLDELTGFELYPTIAGDCVYLGTNTGIVYALDRANGSLRWSFDAATVTGPPVVIDDLVVVGDWTATQVPSYSGWTNYIGQGPVREDNPDRPIPPAVVNGLDAHAGTIRWSTSMPYMTALVANSDDMVIIASATGPSNLERDSVVN